MAKTPHSVCDLLDRLIEVGDGNDTVSIGDIVRTFGSRSYGPVLLVPALIGVSPIGGIPGVPTFLALTLLLFAVQLAWAEMAVALAALDARVHLRGRAVVLEVTPLAFGLVAEEKVLPLRLGARPLRPLQPLRVAPVPGYHRAAAARALGGRSR